MYPLHENDDGRLGCLGYLYDDQDYLVACREFDCREFIICFTTHDDTAYDTVYVAVTISVTMNTAVCDTVCYAVYDGAVNATVNVLCNTAYDTVYNTVYDTVKVNVTVTMYDAVFIVTVSEKRLSQPMNRIRVCGQTIAETSMYTTVRRVLPVQ